MRKILILVAAIMLATSLTACGGTDNTAAKTAAGSYSADGFEAKITDSTIQVFIVNDDSKALYWSGTWKDGGTSVNSVGDREALDASLLGSGSDNKTFKVKGDKIAFVFQAMGMSKTVKMVKK